MDGWQLLATRNDRQAEKASTRPRPDWLTVSCQIRAQVRSRPPPQLSRGLCLPPHEAQKGAKQTKPYLLWACRRRPAKSVYHAAHPGGTLSRGSQASSAAPSTATDRGGGRSRRIRFLDWTRPPHLLSRPGGMALIERRGSSPPGDPYMAFFAFPGPNSCLEASTTSSSSTPRTAL
jgi:hypothetical protein